MKKLTKRTNRSVPLRITKTRKGWQLKNESSQFQELQGTIFIYTF